MHFKNGTASLMMCHKHENATREWLYFFNWTMVNKLKGNYIFYNVLYCLEYWWDMGAKSLQKQLTITWFYRCLVQTPHIVSLNFIICTWETVLKLLFVPFTAIFDIFSWCTSELLFNQFFRVLWIVNCLCVRRDVGSPCKE